MKRFILALLCFNSLLQAQVNEFNTVQLGQWNGAGEIYSDLWGYAAGGKEYAILGSARYIYFFDVTNPANIQLVDRFGPYTSTSWREFKTHSHYAYAVTDGPDAGGLRIFDLQYLPDTVIQVRQTTAFFTKSHMTFIDTANRRLYCAGTNTQYGGIIVLDLSTRPDSPSIVINQALPRGYVHDMYVKNNVMYASHIYAGYLSQYNCTGNACSGELSTYQTGGYNHSNWMNTDQTLMINAIETAGHPLWLFPILPDGKIGTENVKKFKSVTLRDQYPNHPIGDTGSIGHNPYIVGNLAYVSYYTDGVQIYDLSNVNNIRRVAYFDTDRGYTSYSPVFRGCWGTYPFLPSGNILASDIQSGLWIFKTTPCALSQSPTISISSNTSSYPRNSSFTVNATVDDPDGTPVKVEFYNNNVLVGTDLSSPFTYTISPADAAIYNITAKVFDDCNHSTLSSVLTIITTASCNDGFQNGDETEVDCGGSCSSCIQPCPAPFLLSQGKTATQSSTYSAAFPAALAMDGNMTNFNHTGIELQPWWQVDLGGEYQVSSIEIKNRTDCCGDRIKRFRVFVSNNIIPGYSTAGSVYEYNNPTGLTNGQLVNIPNINKTGRYVRIWVDNTGYGNNYLHLAEVKVLGCCYNNQDPTISISSSASSYTQGSSFTVNATANDAGGSIGLVEFYNGNTILGIDNSSPYSHTISPATASSYTITAKAIDDCNGSTISNTLNITTTSTCSDGYHNGNETGVDCGGTCVACNQSCPTPVNLSQGKTATQSSTYSSSYPASKAVDGNTSTINHTGIELQPWWQVDLGIAYQVSAIEITNRQDCCGDRIKRFRVFVSNIAVSSYSTPGYIYEFANAGGLSNGQVINIPNINIGGRYVRIWIENTGYGNNYLHLAEVKVMGCCLNNQNPTISISSASSSYPPGSSITINATANDAGGTVSQVEFYNGTTILGIDNSSPYSHTISAATASSYNITAKAIDNCGGSTTSNNLIITTTSSCTDGYQNGTETGVDCGGNCNACNQSCQTVINLSQGKVAAQSSNYSVNYPASRVVDGNTSNFNHTGIELQPWWQVDLGTVYQLASVEITSRQDCCGDRIKRFRVFVSNIAVSSYSTPGYIYEFANAGGLSNGQVITIPNLSITGRYVRIWVDNTGYGNNYLHLAEVKVMGCVPSGALTDQEPNKYPLFQSTNSGVRMFPNPTRELIRFQFDSLPDSEVTAQIYDLQGRLILSEKLIDNQVNLVRLESGSYIVRIQWNGNRYIHKVVKI